MTVVLRWAVLAAAFGLSPAQAGEEPYGQGFDGWSFTQTDQDGAINCRAKNGTNIFARLTNGKAYVSIPAGKIAKAKFPESTLEIGQNAEMVDAQSFGDRLVFFTDDTVMGWIAANKGYRWTIILNGKPKSGTVKLNKSATKALERLRECVEANGG